MANKRNPSQSGDFIMDNLPVLRCIDSETGGLIYPDLPFNFGRK